MRLLRSRFFRVVAVLALATIFGFVVYGWLGSFRNANGKVLDPTQSSVLINLPGTVVVAQGGNLYSLTNGQFTKIAAGGWTEPAATPDHQHLVAVKRQGNFSDLYELSPSGAIQRQLTDDASGQVELNHWSFYPHVSPDGTQVFYSYDKKYCSGCYLVDLSVYSRSLLAQDQPRKWSTPNQGTGGDLHAIPLQTGGLIYSKFQIDGATNQLLSQIWYQRAQGTPGTALSAAGQSCQQPALSPDGTRLAMICAAEGSATTDLVIASLDLARFTLGPPAVIASGLPSGPSWSPDGKSLIYFSPDTAQGGAFQLYTVQVPAAGGQAAAPKPVTANNDFDATSAPVWHS